MNARIDYRGWTTFQGLTTVAGARFDPEVSRRQSRELLMQGVCKHFMFRLLKRLHGRELSGLRLLWRI